MLNIGGSPILRRMPDIDLEPGKNYRATPVKGEKAFAPGGLRRLLLYAAWLAFGIAVALIVRGPALALSDWLWALWH